MFICFLFLLGMFSNDGFSDSLAQKRRQNNTLVDERPVRF